MADQQAGWYPDPAGDATKLRYWDGTQWTNDYAAAQAQPATQAQPASDAGNGASAEQADGQTVYAQPTYEQSAYAQAAYAQTAYVQPEMMSSTDQSLRLAAFVFCIISAVASCWLIIPLAWMIPMCVRSWGIYKGKKPNTTAFGVCTLIFVSLVGGILLLCSRKDA